MTHPQGTRANGVDKVEHLSEFAGCQLGRLG
jgi:hypothetical protein